MATIKLNLRVIAATNADLDALVAQGKMRADFLARLRGFEIVVPSLRERPEDIEPIAKAILATSYPRLGIEPLCLEALKDYHWPENVRELKKRLLGMAAIAAMGGASLIGFSHFPDDFLAALVESTARRHRVKDEQFQEEGPPTLGMARGSLSDRVITISIPEHLELGPARSFFERDFIKAKINPSSRSQRALAKTLGVARSTLNSIMLKHGLSVDRETEIAGS